MKVKNLAFDCTFQCCSLKRIWLWILIVTNKYSWPNWDQRRSRDNREIQVIEVQIIKVRLYKFVWISNCCFQECNYIQQHLVKTIDFIPVFIVLHKCQLETSNSELHVTLQSHAFFLSNGWRNVKAGGHWATNYKILLRTLMLAETLPKSLVSVFSKLSVRTKINQLQLVAFVCFSANRQILFLLFRANILILLLWFFDKSGITFNSVPSSPLKKTFLVLIKNCHVHVIKWCNPVYFFFIPGWFSSEPNYTYSCHCRDSSRIAFCCICK